MTTVLRLDFPAARQVVQQHLDDVYADWDEHPHVESYGFDTGQAWAPMVDWDGVMGTYVWLVDKHTGALTPLGFNQFLDVPNPARVGPWPANG